MTSYAVRFTPGQDLRPALVELARERGIAAGVVLTAVGSLARAVIRFGGKSQGTELLGDFEILSLVGTLGPDGPHLHICIADDTGKCIGGHMQDGCVVRTTAEVVIASLDGLQFLRRIDQQTNYKELVIEESSGPSR
jgi:predicted DNA-binding protein with PD1-like motif